MSKFEKLINWAVTIATALYLAVQHIIGHIPN